MFKAFDPIQMPLTKYLFFTGKGGVGKTSAACATAVGLADSGKKVLIVSTDPASNLHDLFGVGLSNQRVQIEEIPNLMVANLDPVQAAADYRESIIAPYRGKLPEAVIRNMEEQLSGSCTAEVSAFNQFADYMTDEGIAKDFDHIIFDTAPTGHTLRLLQLPSAWSDFISQSTQGTSRVGLLRGLESKKDVYKKAVGTISNNALTSLVLVARPEETPLLEAKRTMDELKNLGVNHQILVINGVFEKGQEEDLLAKAFYEKQQSALSKIPLELKGIDTYYIPLRSYNIVGIKNIRALLNRDEVMDDSTEQTFISFKGLQSIVDDIYKSKKKIIFTMGKGGVGKTTIAAAIAMGLARKGMKIHLSTTDPAAHLKMVINEQENIKISNIDEKQEHARYSQEVLSKAKATMGENDIAYVEEVMRSPCSQEIAVFRRFAEIVEHSYEEVVVIDTAPTGHTLLLLDATQSYHREIQHSQGDIPESVKKLLPRLRNPEETEVIIITLAETTPVHEAEELLEDLVRAGIKNKWWVINSSVYAAQTSSKILRSKSNLELEWIKKVDEITEGNFAVIGWKQYEIKGEKLMDLL